MKVIASTIHKCLKFPCNGKIITVSHITYQPIVRHGDIFLYYFWSKQFRPLHPRSDSLFRSYQNWKNEMILSLNKPRNPTLGIPLDDNMPLLEDKIILPPMERNNLLPKEQSSTSSPKDKIILPPKESNRILPRGESISSPMDESTFPPKGIKFPPPQNQSILPKGRPIPPPYDRFGLLPRPPIPPLYGAVPPPSSYREKKLTSPIIQPKRSQPIHPSIKEETKLTLDELNPSTKTRQNHCAREH